MFFFFFFSSSSFFFRRFFTRVHTRLTKAPAARSFPVHLVIDWTPDVLARFFDDGQWSRVKKDASVDRCRKESLSPTDLHQCMRAFTKPETIAGDDQPYW
jgi:hypothetical protein